MSWTHQIHFPPRSAKTLFGRKSDYETENVRLRELLREAADNAERLKARAGLLAVENEDAVRWQRLIAEELHHRAKNTLAIVMSMTSQSLKNAVTVEAGRRALEARILALGRSQDLLLMAHGSNVQVGIVVTTAIEPFVDKANKRFDINAERFDLGGEAILPFTLSLNELCTNAAKYGALSVDSGRVAIAATADRDTQRFRLTWIETGGPPVQEPSRRSFGSRLIQSLAEQLHGNAHLRFDPEGVNYELDAPLMTRTFG